MFSTRVSPSKDVWCPEQPGVENLEFNPLSKTLQNLLMWMRSFSSSSFFFFYPHTSNLTKHSQTASGYIDIQTSGDGFQRVGPVCNKETTFCISLPLSFSLTQVFDHWRLDALGTGPITSKWNIGFPFCEDRPPFFRRRRNPSLPSSLYSIIRKSQLAHTVHNGYSVKTKQRSEKPCGSPLTSKHFSGTTRSGSLGPRSETTYFTISPVNRNVFCSRPETEFLSLWISLKLSLGVSEKTNARRQTKHKTRVWAVIHLVSLNAVFASRHLLSKQDRRAERWTAGGRSPFMAENRRVFHKVFLSARLSRVFTGLQMCLLYVQFSGNLFCVPPSQQHGARRVMNTGQREGSARQHYCIQLSV